MKTGETNGTHTDLLLQIWRQTRYGDVEDARARLLQTWVFYMDAFASPQAGRVTAALFKQFGFSTDDKQGWHELPDPVPVFRAGAAGIAWSTDLDVVLHLAREHGLSPI